MVGIALASDDWLAKWKGFEISLSFKRLWINYRVILWDHVVRGGVILYNTLFITQGFSAPSVEHLDGFFFFLSCGAGLVSFGLIYGSPSLSDYLLVVLLIKVPFVRSFILEPPLVYCTPQLAKHHSLTCRLQILVVLLGYLVFSIIHSLPIDRFCMVLMHIY
ncbi:hypothetical protein PanWU01x14_094770 [Parasponia andersonii]|uniref:Uncharacterized protein n=1 Tax=Parasponia andersonii TaxID=3476 RepID=A0A2P5D5H8_PARAD|nr:hypothetical protein PanWU01x14_094770 [Parasponia andersonii]